jgi:sulfite dehydrogenase (cytochrome) subunit B
MHPRGGRARLGRAGLALGLQAALAAATFGATPHTGGDAAHAPAAEVSALRDGEGRDLTVSRCIICHSVEYIPANAPAMDRAAWQKSIQKMRERFGAPVTDDEAKQILDYLAANYSAKS